MKNALAKMGRCHADHQPPLIWTQATHTQSGNLLSPLPSAPHLPIRNSLRPVLCSIKVRSFQQKFTFFLIGHDVFQVFVVGYSILNFSSLNTNDFKFSCRNQNRFHYSQCLGSLRLGMRLCSSVKLGYILNIRINTNCF